MLVEFSVENFLSFKERVTFSMLASKDTEHEDINVITLENGKRYLKTAVIYGANASGKSNLLKAMDFMADFVRKSHQMQIGTPIGVIPFKLDLDCLCKPSRFDIIFISEGVKYAYGFSATSKEVIEEYLYYYPNGRQSTIFERTNVNEYKFTDDKEIQNSLKERNTTNKLYLSTAANWNYEKVYSAFNWFANFSLYDEQTAPMVLFANYINMESDVKNVNIPFSLIKHWIKSIDLGIKDVKILNPDVIGGIGKNNNIEMFKNIETIHEIKKNNGNVSNIQFNMMEESDGTRKFFLIALELAINICTGNLSLVDELDTHFHTLLSKYIIEIYNNAENNPLNAQLLFTTHDTNLLDLNVLRRDQIWFTEKNPDTGTTDLYSLYDFGVRKDVNIEKGYLLGRYGAIPFIGGNING